MKRYAIKVVDEDGQAEDLHGVVDGGRYVFEIRYGEKRYLVAAGDVDAARRYAYHNILPAGCCGTPMVTEVGEVIR